MTSQHDLYICEKCGGKFLSAWAEQAAESERRRNFPDTPTAECVMVCDDCFKILMEKHRADPAR
jgi:DNA-directed RNA polymerase subunit RPC12/RpoP